MSDLIQGYSAMKAGKQKAYDLEMETKQDEIATIQRESDRKRSLAEALASQNAMAGMKNIAAFEGSPLSIMEEDRTKEKKGTSRDQFEARIRKRVRRSQGKNAKMQGYMSLMAGVAKTGGQAAGVMGGGATGQGNVTAKEYGGFKGTSTGHIDNKYNRYFK